MKTLIIASILSLSVITSIGCTKKADAPLTPEMSATPTTTEAAPAINSGDSTATPKQ